ncbi:cell division protein FtsQ/DivIB [Paenibacillus sp. GYB003]|uniref:cell division protein FtsQ/DivIB n=1 Tax=Paenibacillus sp. GYB003 TaxID=2994392 RepID=UPI002F96D04B
MQERMPVLREEKPRPRRGSRKLLFFLLLLFVTLLAVLFFRSSLSKIASIDITGNKALTAEEVGQAAAIAIGDNFFGFRSSAVENRIRQLPAVESVTVTKKFPGSLRIAVQEYPHVAFQIRPTGEKEMVLANGLALPVKERNIVMDKPILSGWDDANPWKLELCGALRRISDKMLAEISEIRPSPTNTYEDKIKMYTRSQFEVYTTVTYLPDKIQYVEEMIDFQVMDKQTDPGVLELLEADTFIPFEMYYGKPQGTAAGGQKSDAKDPQKKGN